MLSLLVGMLCLTLPHLVASGRILSPPLSASQLHDPGEQDEIQAGLDKCFPTEVPRATTSTELEAPAAESFLNLGEEDVGTHLVGNNASQLTLSSRGLSSFVNFQCTNEEMNAFKAMYGLKGVSDLNLASFGYNEICQENNVVWLYPTEDHNGAFRINENVCHRLTVWSQKACSVQFKRVSSVEEASRFLGKFPANSVMHIVLGGHGSRGKSLQWGKMPHFFGVTEDRGKVPLGRTVSWRRPVTTLTKARPTISAHTRGYVNVLDKDGDVHVLFEREGGVFLTPSNFERDVTIHSSSFQVITQLRNVMQQHASIFLDSCSSASSSAHPSLARFVARMVGKGVRVIGSEVPFGNVNVRSFGAWHVSIHGKEVQHAQREFTGADARCPSFARRSRPDAGGDCQCGWGRGCRTNEGGLCPAAGGGRSGSRFLPFCAEEWSKVRCTCVRSKGAVSRPLAVPALALLGLMLGS